MASLLANASVGGTQICYADYLGLALISQIRISYGSQSLQKIERDQLFIFGHRMLRDEQLFHWQRMVGGGMTQAARILACQIRQYIRTSLSTLWINQIESNALMVNALSGKLAIEIVRSFSQLI